MKLKPPHYNAIMFNGRQLALGESVDVSDHEIPSLLAEGWRPVEEKKKHTHKHEEI